MKFKHKHKKSKKASPLKISLNAFTFCIIIHWPNFLVKKVASDEILYKLFKLCIETNFSLSLHGEILLGACYSLSTCFGWIYNS